jgi:hypothetical protein
MLLVFGGQNKSGPLGDLALLDMTSMIWYRPKPSGNPPSKRSGHTAHYKDGQVNPSDAIPQPYTLNPQP